MARTRVYMARRSLGIVLSMTVEKCETCESGGAFPISSPAGHDKEVRQTQYECSERRFSRKEVSRVENMKKIILALIVVLALFSGINPKVRGHESDKNHDHEHDDDDHDGCFFIFHG